MHKISKLLNVNKVRNFLTPFLKIIKGKPSVIFRGGEPYLDPTTKYYLNPTTKQTIKKEGERLLEKSRPGFTKLGSSPNLG